MVKKISRRLPIFSLSLASFGLPTVLCFTVDCRCHACNAIELRQMSCSLTLACCAVTVHQSKEPAREFMFQILYAECPTLTNNVFQHALKAELVSMQKLVPNFLTMLETFTLVIGTQLFVMFICNITPQ